jgi:sugar phosphate isomerase/epimerase
MNRNNIYISTVAPDACEMAREHGFGLEIAEYCTAWNMDEHFESTHASVSKKLQGVPHCVLHGPFNELFPCAIDPKVRELTALRFGQAIGLADLYGAKKIVLHSGYYERMYYPQWFVSESIKFWREFMEAIPDGFVICVENVFEQTPELLRDIVRGVDHPRFRICLDIGHVNAYSDIPLGRWLDICAPYISHFHVHNNDGSADTHSSLADGSMDMGEFFARAATLCPDATYTLEVREAQPSCLWLQKMQTK